MKVKHSPYPLFETVCSIKRKQFGLNEKHKGLVAHSPKCFHLNNNVVPKVRIAFLGDIMSAGKKNLEIGSGVKEFVRGCDYLVGNFEGTITDVRNPARGQRHRLQVLDALTDLFPPDRTYLGLANNHAGDFGYEIWAQSKKLLEARGFHTFGSAINPYCDIGGDIRIIAGTHWSNHPCNYIAYNKDTPAYIDRNRFNILFTHWGYEYELYPRPETIAEGARLAGQFDALVGHHSHCPQPVTGFAAANANKLLAYSLGDFCIAANMEQFLYGITLRVEIGASPEGATQIGQVDWQFTYSDNLSTSDKVKVETKDSLPAISQLRPSSPFLRMLKKTRIGTGALPGR